MTNTTMAYVHKKRMWKYVSLLRSNNITLQSAWRHTHVHTHVHTRTHTHVHTHVHTYIYTQFKHVTTTNRV